jgi:serine/threonine protein phosphatase PrpC
LKQITEDHSVVWEYYIRNIITKNEIIESNIKHLITEAIGLNYYPRINSYKIPLPEQFIFLLCSDGLTDVVTDDKIETIIHDFQNDLQSCAKELHKLALKTVRGMTLLLSWQKREFRIIIHEFDGYQQFH